MIEKLVLFLDIENLLAVIETAIRADAMGFDHCATVWASIEIASLQCQMLSSDSLSHNASSSSWCCHNIRLRFLIQIYKQHSKLYLLTSGKAIFFSNFLSGAYISGEKADIRPTQLTSRRWNGRAQDTPWPTSTIRIPLPFRSSGRQDSGAWNGRRIHRLPQSSDRNRSGRHC